MLARIRTALAGLLLGAGTLAAATGAMAQEVKLTFLHVNDVFEITPTDGAGGFAQLAAVLKREKAKNPNTLITYGGGLLAPSVLSGMTKGEPMIELANAVGIDAAVVGHHEFAYGPDVLKQRVTDSKFPWLGSNVTGADGKLLSGLRQTFMKEVGGVKVGFFGIITPAAVFLSAAGPTVKFQPIVDSARAAVKQLKDQGADVIVALTYLLTVGDGGRSAEDVLGDRELIKAVPEINAVLGGRDLERKATLEGGVPILKTQMNAIDVGQLDLFVTKAAGRVTVRSGFNRFETKDVAPDPQVAELVKKWTDKLDKELSVAVGKVAVAIDSRRDTVRTVESAIGNLIADAIRDAAKADVTIYNTGGIRGNKTYDANYTLTRKDVLTELPFGHRALLVEISGAALWAALENGVSEVENRAGRFPAVSGVKLTYDSGKPAGGRIAEILVGGKPLDKAAKYKLASTDFLYQGGDGYTETIGKAAKLAYAKEGVLVAQLVMDYVSAIGTVSPKVEGRIVAK